MKSEDLKIEGMTCGHCVMSVKKELAKLATLKIEDVQIGQARVQYDENRITHDDLAQAINEAGYQLILTQG